MRVLCISQQIPGDLESMAQALAVEPANTVLMASMRHRNAPELGSVRRILLKKCNVEKFAKDYLGYLALAIRTAQDAASSWQGILATGFEPDLILCCATNGIAFGLREYFAKSFIVNYADAGLLNLYFNNLSLYKARKLIEEQQFESGSLNFRRGLKQCADFRLTAAKKPKYLPYFTDCAYFTPESRPSHNLLLFCGASPEINLNALFSCLSHLLLANPSFRVTIIAENALLGTANPTFLTHFPESCRSRIAILRSLARAQWRDAIHDCGAALCAGLDICSLPRILDIMSCAKIILLPKRAKIAPGAKCALTLPAKEADWPRFIAKTLSGGDDKREFGKEARKMVCSCYNQEAILPEHLKEILGRMA